MTRFATALVVVALLPLATPRRSHAQLGGLIKKKVTEAVKGPEKSPGDQKPRTAESNPGGRPPGFNSDVLEITEPVFASVIRGLETELRLQEEFRQELAKFPTQEQYDQCLAKAVQGPEYAKIMETMAKTPENATAEQVMAAQMKMASDLEAFTKKHCPVQPASTEWPNGRRMERLEEIRVKAAEAAGAGMSASRSEPDSRMSFAFTYEVEPAVGLGPFAGWTVTQYAIAIERIDRLCDYNNGPAGVGVVPDTLHKRDSTQNNLMITGTGKNIFWVFTSRETGVVNSPNCRRFKDLTKRLM